ncbi:MAG: hypothetical protein HZB38_03885, partial [Planctomycetes bacterium]|nr:hypothetical protein [Planctomycetota bacterium]
MIAGRYCCGLALLCCSLLITGCPPAGSTAVATRISTVDPLTEPEFDSFAGRIASKLAPLAQTGSRSIALGSPQLVVDDEANRPAARYFSYALMDGLTDRMGGTLTFGRAATEAVQYRTVLLFNRKAQTVEFVVTDANGQREVVRESAQAAEQPAVAATREPADVAAVREPAAVAVTPPSSPPPAQPEPPPPPAAEPPTARPAPATPTGHALWGSPDVAAEPPRTPQSASDRAPL